MNRECLWKMRAISLNLLSYGTNQVSRFLCLFYRYSVFNLHSNWRACMFVIEYERCFAIHSRDDFAIHYLKVLIWRVTYCIMHREVGGCFMGWVAGTRIYGWSRSVKAQMTCFSKSSPQFLLLNYFLYFQIKSASSSEIENLFKIIMFELWSTQTWLHRLYLL